ncbi:hypothetical protein NEOLEDRAFT_1130487 [Neolentinus lepideus HHB14362 ss-1]|uniref:EKC/KEOPS complex subunit GON7 n=1 Tax=Neolentinus lepideus HHB14362 ss-1 TaxID=1314782 RepID=A0A165U1X8_9AGAM|nr:hypothetical protein NEOLEDRAFT_1130487 [Neolentinus lepideus HHB14362 ss-1]
MSRTIAITYDLHLHEGVTTKALSANKTHEFPVSSGEGKDYYNSLQTAVNEAKAKLGEELTAWRDIVGDKEQGKEKNVPMKNDDDDDDEEEEADV